MDGHLQAGFFRYRHNFLQEIKQMLFEFGRINFSGIGLQGGEGFVQA